MALSDVFLTPLGLAALGIAVPIILLYFVRPDPSRMRLPTFRFLREQEKQRATTPLMERLSRSVLLLIQLLALALLAATLATPYVPVSETAVIEETVVVVDTSASMATSDGDQRRFDRAIAAAGEAVTDTTSVVRTDGGGEVVLRRGPPAAAEAAIAGLAVTDAPGDLRTAIAQARALADEDVRIVVLSDFAGDSWTDTVATTRARGVRVDLQQFDGGGAGNVGFVDRRFSETAVTLSLKNFGTVTTTRTVALGDASREVELDAGGVRSVTLPVPAGGGTATLSPGDDFQTDDAVPVAAPADPTVDVLVLTNDENQYLTTALAVARRVDVTVDHPPTTVEDEYDVILYSNVDPDALLPGNVAAGRDVVAEGGGVAVQAQSAWPDYQDLLLVEPTGTASATTVEETAESALTEGVNFQPPEEYVSGSLREGKTLVSLGDGSPLIATAERANGRLLYYGYIQDRSSFKFNYQYPVFWKRAVFYLADREPIAALNHETGETVTFEDGAIDGPTGTLSGPTVQLRDAGFYRSGGRRHGVGLLAGSESRVAVEPLAERDGPGETVTRTAERTVPRRLTEYGALAALLVVLVEIGYLRRRGDL